MSGYQASDRSKQLSMHIKQKRKKKPISQNAHPCRTQSTNSLLTRPNKNFTQHKKCTINNKHKKTSHPALAYRCTSWPWGHLTTHFGSDCCHTNLLHCCCCCRLRWPPRCFSAAGCAARCQKRCALAGHASSDTHLQIIEQLNKIHRRFSVKIKK